MTSLEALVEKTAIDLGISRLRWSRFRRKLEELKIHNERMYRHSLRVGLYACGLAQEEHVDDCKLSLYGGCAHDLGKAHVDNCVLDADCWTEDCSRAIKCHPKEGYEMLKDQFLFAGIVAGLHHKLQPNGYGIDLADVPVYLAPESIQKIIEATELVIVSDFFDALTTRKNDKGFVKDPDDIEEVKSFMSGKFPEVPDRVEWLVTHKVNDR